MSRRGKAISFYAARRTPGAVLYAFLLDNEGFRKWNDKWPLPTEDLSDGELLYGRYGQIEYALIFTKNACKTLWPSASINVGLTDSAEGRCSMVSLIASTAVNDELIPPTETLETLREYLISE
ncbi:hypothetical protein H0H81_008505 [Sphagnurus paluster]|uniref:Uncharacterized protein n=1 Tax=Sphagnurus paluster TaxID=117069 RepID=A0A9P7GIW2_9AGAR|nr:hypothetical protein H0H81_008505 [Sphagnurus paluster]